MICHTSIRPRYDDVKEGNFFYKNFFNSKFLHQPTERGWMEMEMVKKGG
jgi:hypothetical protein